MHIKPFQAVFPRMDYITSSDSFFGSVKVEYPEYIKSGFFNKTSHESIYLYQIREEEGRPYTGVIACAAIQDYLEGHIIKHEETLAEKEQKQLHLLLRRNAIVKPVLLTYSPVPEIERFIEAYIQEHSSFLKIHFDGEQQYHEFWEVRDGQQIRILQSLFEKYILNTYIADGHHRTSSTARLYHQQLEAETGKEYDQLLCAFFPTSQLEILDYNRIVEGLNGHSEQGFIALLSQVTDIQILNGPALPQQTHELVMYIHEEWFSLKWKKEVLERYSDQQEVILDVQLLNELILDPILGIQDLRHDSRIKYVEGTKGLKGLSSKVLRHSDRVGFMLHPIDMKDFLSIADAGEVLPPKSTWFEPRMRNGLIVKEYGGKNNLKNIE
jgi:uncharacterized protein (DUF1015 family)